MKFVLFQINANFRINQLKNIFTQNTWHYSFMTWKNLSSPSQNLLKTPTFHPIYNSFTVVEVCNIKTKNHSLSYLAKYHYFYTRGLISFLHFGKTMALSIANIFQNIQFLPHFHYVLTVSEVCNNSKKYWLLNKSATKIFLQKTPYTAPSFQQKSCALDRRWFQKERLFIT